MAEMNPLWGAPRIHGELLKLGIDVSQATVAKYMPRHRRPPSQTWRTFLANHIDQITAADFFVVPTATCRLLFVLVILAHQRPHEPSAHDEQRRGCPVGHTVRCERHCINSDARMEFLVGTGYLGVTGGRPWKRRLKCAVA